MKNKFKVGDSVTYKHQPFTVVVVPNPYFVVVVEGSSGKTLTVKADIMRSVVAEPVEHCCICLEDLPQGHKAVCKRCFNWFDEGMKGGAR